MHEELLVERARGGDVPAFEELVRHHQTLAFRTAYLITGSAADAEEAVQDAFVKAHAALGRFRRGAPLRPWLLRIVANEARTRRRAHHRREALVLQLSREPVAARSGPEESLDRAALRDRLLAALNGLREEERLVLACRYFLDLSQEETAAALSLRTGTVKSRHSRALARLREAMGEPYE